MKLHTVHHVIRDLLLEVGSGRLAEPDALALAARRVQTALACTWISFDKISGSVGKRVQRRLLACHGSGRVVTTPDEKHETSGGYFGPLVNRGFYACEDTLADPTFAHLADGFLRPNGVRALMTAAIPGGTNGSTWYTLSCVSDRPRRWRAEEVTALRRCASAARPHALARRGGKTLLST